MDGRESVREKPHCSAICKIMVPGRRRHLSYQYPPPQSLPVFPLQKRELLFHPEQPGTAKHVPGLMPCSAHNCFQNSIPTTTQKGTKFGTLSLQNYSSTTKVYFLMSGCTVCFTTKKLIIQATVYTETFSIEVADRCILYKLWFSSGCKGAETDCTPFTWRPFHMETHSRGGIHPETHSRAHRIPPNTRTIGTQLIQATVHVGAKSIFGTM